MELTECYYSSSLNERFYTKYEGTVGGKKTYIKTSSRTMLQHRKKEAAFFTGDRSSLHYYPRAKIRAKKNGMHPKTENLENPTSMLQAITINIRQKIMNKLVLINHRMRRLTEVSPILTTILAITKANE